MLLACGVIALAAGCGSDAPTAPRSENSLDLNAVLAEMSVGSLGSFPAASAMLAIPVTAAPPTITTSGCAYSASVQGFVCPPVTIGGLTFASSYFLYDAAGHSQSQPSAATTASVRTVTDVAGTTSLPATTGTSGSISVSSHSDMTLSGLLTAPRALNGTSTEHEDMTLTGSTPLHSVIDMTNTTTNLVMPLSTMAGSMPWPLSGSIASDMTVASSTGPLPSVAGTIHMVMTFNGTSTVTMVMTISGHTTTCTVDLMGSGVPVCS